MSRDQYEEITVSLFREVRQPWRASPLCPACNSMRVDPTYTEAQTMRLADGVIDATSFGAKPDPHLVLRCTICGFSWESKVCFP